MLITAEMVDAMAPGSVIVDLAAERGGNCELTRPGETVVEQGVHDSRPGQPALRRSLSRQPDVRQEHDHLPRPSPQGRAKSRSTWPTKSRAKRSSPATVKSSIRGFARAGDGRDGESLSAAPNHP